MKPAITAIAIFFFLVFNPATTFSQQHLQPGYVIKLNGDTLKGMIDFRNWISNPTEVSFIENGAAVTIIYKPVEIKKFEVANEGYVSAIVTHDKTSGNVSELGYEKELEITTDTLFLQVLFSGNKSLYYYRDTKSPEQFFVDEKEGITWLVYKSYLRDFEGRTVEEQNNSFQQQLAAYLQDCPSLNAKAFNISYSKNELKKLFRDYYTCKNSTNYFEKKNEKIRLETGILAGISINKVDFASPEFKYLTNGNFGSSTSATGGIFLNIIFNRKLKHWSFNNELFYNSYESKGNYTETLSAQNHTNYYTTIGFSYLKVNNMFRYTIPAGKLSVFLNAGFSNGFMLKKTNYLKREESYYSAPVIKEGVAIQNIRNHEQSYILGAGARISKISFDIRYEAGNGMINMSYLSASTTRLYFLVGYTF